MHVRINGQYAAPCATLVRPVRAFHSELNTLNTRQRIPMSDWKRIYDSISGGEVAFHEIKQLGGFCREDNAKL